MMLVPARHGGLPPAGLLGAPPCVAQHQCTELLILISPHAFTPSPFGCSDPTCHPGSTELPPHCSCLLLLCPSEMLHGPSASTFTLVHPTS